MKRIVMEVFVAGFFGLHVGQGLAQASFAIDWHSVDGGGGTSTGGAFSLGDSSGTPAAGVISGGSFSVEAGFWSLDAVTNSSTIIFDNTNGSVNGYEGVSASNFLADKLCVKTQAYNLDSITLLVANGNMNAATSSSSFQLRLFSDDPSKSKPLADLGLVLNLSGATNPVTFGVSYVETPLTWIPAAPFTLLANTCYWVVLSATGDIVAEAATFTAPAGDAASLGRASSPDAGATWTVDLFTSRKMLILGTPAAGPTAGLNLAAQAMGSDLGLSFASSVGHSYVVQSRSALSSGTWATLPNASVLATGTTAQIIVTNAFGQPSQFYRLKDVP